MLKPMCLSPELSLLSSSKWVVRVANDKITTNIWGYHEPYAMSAVTKGTYVDKITEIQSTG